MATYVIVLMVVFFGYSFIYDMQKSDMRAIVLAQYSIEEIASREVWALFLSFSFLVVLNILFALDKVPLPSGLPWSGGDASLVMKIAHVVIFIVAVLVPCMNIVYGLQRLGVSRGASAALANFALMTTVFWPFSKGWLQ